MTIFKYPLAVIDTQQLLLPPFSEILSAQLQGGRLTMWAMVNNEPPTEPRVIVIFGTGHAIPYRPSSLVFIDTVQQGPLVWHIFELLP